MLRHRELKPSHATVVRLISRSWLSFHICVLTLLLTEVTLRVLEAGDFWATGVIPLLWLLFGIPGPASWSVRSDEPVLPLNEKEYSKLRWKQSNNKRHSQGKAYKKMMTRCKPHDEQPESHCNWSSTNMTPSSSKTFTTH